MDTQTETVAVVAFTALVSCAAQQKYRQVVEGSPAYNEAYICLSMRRRLETACRNILTVTTITCY